MAEDRAAFEPAVLSAEVSTTLGPDPVGAETLELFAESPAYNALLWRRLNALAPVRGTVLEIGCGIGTITERILGEPDVSAVTVIDRDPDYVRRVLDRLSGPRLSGVAASLEDFEPVRFDEAQDGRYDRIVCSNVLEHIEDDVRALREFRRMLRPGGAVLLLVPAHPALYSSLDVGLSHFRRYTRRDLGRLASDAGLRLARSRYFNPVGILGWWLNGKVLRRATLPAAQLRAYGRLAVGVSDWIDRLNPLPFGISVVGAFERPDEPEEA